MSPVWGIFAQRFEKLLALFMVCGQSQDEQLPGSLKQIRTNNCFSRLLLLETNNQTEFFLLKVDFGFSPFDHREVSFP